VPGRRRPGTAKPKARGTTGISTWACSREDGTPKLALKDFAGYTPGFGLCQPFHFQDHRLDGAVRWMRELGVRYVRMGLSWADSLRPDAQAWFDRPVRALEPFDVTVTFCFTPDSEGVRPHHTSPPRHVTRFAEFCAEQVRRYAQA
jgi:beta-xylosidase